MTASPPTRTVTFLLRQRRQAQGYREALQPDVAADSLEQGAEGGNEPPALTLLWIPPGRFWMGSPTTEGGRVEDEGPPHLVQLQGFFMAQTPITQAQWRAVAGWREREGERWGRDLDPDPSFFQPRSNPKARSFFESRFSLLQGESNSDQRPVDNVSWLEAMEFCSRLSQRTGRHYTLPSEAQWE